MYQTFFTGGRPNAPRLCLGGEGRPDPAAANAATQVGCATGGEHHTSKEAGFRCA